MKNYLLKTIGQIMMAIGFAPILWGMGIMIASLFAETTFIQNEMSWMGIQVFMFSMFTCFVMWGGMETYAKAEDREWKSRSDERANEAAMRRAKEMHTAEIEQKIIENNWEKFDIMQRNHALAERLQRRYGKGAQTGTIVLHGYTLPMMSEK